MVDRFDTLVNDRDHDSIHSISKREGAAKESSNFWPFCQNAISERHQRKSEKHNTSCARSAIAEILREVIL
jgi:hypothetical protein